MQKKEVLKSIYKFDENPLVIADDEMIEGCECDDVIAEEFLELKKLGEAMIKLTVEKNGLGLAAPQVGVMRKMFIWMNGSNSFQIVLNPKFFPDKKTTNVVEGCLSYPGLWLAVKRPKEVTLSYQTVTGEYVVETFTGLLARIAQHEFDHMEGLNFSDHVSQLKLDMALKSLNKRARKYLRKYVKQNV